MLKKVVLVTVLAVAPVSVVQACIVMAVSPSPIVFKALENGWDFKNYHAICKKLNAANAALQIGAYTTVLNGVAIAWANVFLKDKDLEVFAPDYGGNATTTNTTPSMSVAQELLPQTINQAVNSINFDKAIASLDANRKKIRAAYQKK